MGRFTSPDPSATSAKLSDPGSWNRYAYVGGDPISRMDPSGLCSEYMGQLSDDDDEGLGDLLYSGPCQFDPVSGAVITSQVEEVAVFGTADPAPTYASENDTSITQDDGDDGDSITAQQQQQQSNCPFGQQIINGICDVPIYGIQGQGAQILKAVGDNASHGLACFGQASPFGLGGALFIMGQPVPGTKPFVTPGSSVGTSPISSALRGSLPDAPVQLPMLVGGPGTGRDLSMAWTTDTGAWLGRAAPFLGIAGLVWGLFSLNSCLSSNP